MRARSALLALAAALLFGLSTPLAKRLLGSVDPLMLAAWLYLGSGTGLGVVLLLRAAASRAPLVLPSRRDAVALAAAIGLGGVLAPILFVNGLAATSAANASLLLNFEGAFTAVFAWVLFRENVDRRILAGTALLVAGGVALSLDGALRGGALRGMLLVVAACLAWGLDNNLTRKASGADAMALACMKGLVAGSVNLAIALLSEAAWPAPRHAAAAAGVGFIGYGVSLTLFVVALRQLGASRTSAYFATAPFFGAVLAVALTSEPATPLLLLAAVLMAAGVWLHLTERHEHWHHHAAQAHVHAHVHDEHHRHAHDFPWDGKEPHAHRHVHDPVEHSHPHYPDLHHRHH